MIQLQPQEYFTIVRGIEDHTDSNTYYVRAVIRNARTDVVIDTVELTDQGNRRFSKEWQVPADTSGQGFYIVITTTVYTDSGYTTKSSLYGEKFDTYLVQERFNTSLGTGGGAYVNYEKIEKIIDEKLALIPQPKEKKVDLEPIKRDVFFLSKKIDNIRIPEQKQVDLTEVVQLIKGVLNKIAEIHIPEPEKVNFTPVLEAIQKADLDKAEQRIASIENRIKEYYMNDMRTYIDGVKEIKEKLDQIPTILIPERIEKKDVKPNRKREFKL